jgi:hypothetical protein
MVKELLLVACFLVGDVAVKASAVVFLVICRYFWGLSSKGIEAVEAAWFDASIAP